MMSKMKAAVVHELGKPLAIEEVPVPQPSENQILVRIAATGICHTDLHAVHGDWPVKPKPPFIPGHEGVGTVVAVGRAVRGVKEGDRVGIPWLHTACGYCSYCRTGWETLCGSQLNSGYSVNGSFAEYALADPAYVGRLPDSSRLGAGGADPVRRRDRLQGTQGNRGEAGRMGRDLGNRRPGPHGGSIREGDGHARRRGRCASREARAREVARCRNRARREGRRTSRTRCKDSSKVPTVRS